MKQSHCDGQVEQASIPTVFTLTQCAAYLQVSPKTVRRLIQRLLLHPLKHLGVIRIARAEVDRVLGIGPSRPARNPVYHPRLREESGYRSSFRSDFKRAVKPASLTFDEIVALVEGE